MDTFNERISTNNGLDVAECRESLKNLCFSVSVAVVHHLISTRKVLSKSPYLAGEVKYLIIGA